MSNNNNTACFQEGPCFLRGEDTGACRILTEEYYPGEKCPFQKVSRFEPPVMTKEESLERLTKATIEANIKKTKLGREWNELCGGVLKRIIDEKEQKQSVGA